MIASYWAAALCGRDAPAAAQAVIVKLGGLDILPLRRGRGLVRLVARRGRRRGGLRRWFDDERAVDQFHAAGAKPAWRIVNISAAERVGRIVRGLAAIIAGIKLQIAAGFDLAVIGALGHCPFYAKLGHTPRLPAKSAMSPRKQHGAGVHDAAETDHLGRTGPGHGGHGHGWMMFVCCVPVLIIAIVLVSIGAVGAGFPFAALACTAVMAATTDAVRGGGHDDRH